MLDGDLHTHLRDDGFGLLKRHNTRCRTLLSRPCCVNLEFTRFSAHFPLVHSGAIDPAYLLARVKKVLTGRCENDYT
jgi:hypothetical protein